MYYPDDNFPHGQTLSSIFLQPEVEYRWGDAGVHDDQVGESVRGVLDHAETSEAAPVLAHQGQILYLTETYRIYVIIFCPIVSKSHIQMIEELPESETMELMRVIVRICVFVRFPKTY